MKFLDCVIRRMARNQVDRGSLLDSKMVPAVTLHWLRQAEHCQYIRPSRRNELCTARPQSGQTKPSGQRAETSAASQSSSLP